MAIGDTLAEEFFDGNCTFYKSVNCGGTQRGLGGMGATTILNTLYNDGRPSFSRTADWFETFAKAMTNKLRSNYGSRYNNTDQVWGTMPLDVIQGTEWRTTVCVEMRLQWLAFPAALTVATILLFAWTSASDWQHRRITPVWKDSILPFLFYRDRFESNGGQTLQEVVREGVGSGGQKGQSERENRLMGADEMSKAAGKLSVSFRWERETRDTDDANATSTSILTDNDAFQSRSVSSPDMQNAAPEERDPNQLKNHTKQWIGSDDSIV